MIENKYIYIYLYINIILLSLPSYPACFSHRRQEKKTQPRLNEERRRKVIVLRRSENSLGSPYFFSCTDIAQLKHSGSVVKAKGFRINNIEKCGIAHFLVQLVFPVAQKTRCPVKLQ